MWENWRGQFAYKESLKVKMKILDLRTEVPILRTLFTYEVQEECSLNESIIDALLTTGGSTTVF